MHQRHHQPGHHKRATPAQFVAVQPNPALMVRPPSHAPPTFPADVRTT
jgi:hypothetical protein